MAQLGITIQDSRIVWKTPIPYFNRLDRSGCRAVLLQSFSKWSGFAVLLLLSMACSAGGLLQRPVDTPVPTRPLPPTFTATPVDNDLLPQVVVTARTPGVIEIEEGMDPSQILPTLYPTITPSKTPTPIATATVPGEIGPGEGGEPPVDENGTPLPMTATPEFTPTITETPTPSPTETPVPTPTITPIPPTPYVVVPSGIVSLRSGPGVEYPLVAQLGPLVPIAITGQNPEGSWYRICCVNRNEAAGLDGTVWVASEHVQTVNDPSRVELVVPVGSPPAPTPTNSLTPTPTITETPTATPVPFTRVLGPQFFSTCNAYLIIWAKLFAEAAPDEVPLGGYYLEVLFGEDERPSTNGDTPSVEEFYRIRVPGTGYGDLDYNVSYEFGIPTPVPTVTLVDCPNSNLPTGNWKVYVVDGEGTRLSDIVEFSTSPTNTYREVYISWKRIR